jgi:metal-sulfur cluster biosynthetic enzyme|tara:strand:+ start:133 stop:462 length:330 start_codon:yes stop_codon:yes gene_type:complete
MDKELDKPKLAIFEKIVENLKQVYDPEISVNVYDLGLIYRIDLEQLPKAHITHTLTSAFCPAADQIVADIRSAAESVEGVESCEIETTFDPPFGPEMMTEEVKLALGIF